MCKLLTSGIEMARMYGDEEVPAEDMFKAGSTFPCKSTPRSNDETAAGIILLKNGRKITRKKKRQCVGCKYHQK